MFGLVPWRRRREKVDQPVVAEFEPLVRLRDEIDRLFSRFLERRELAGPWFDWRWGLDLEDRDDEVVVRIDAPGFEPEDFDVRISGNLLTVRAQHREEGSGGGGQYCRYGMVRRVVSLPPGVDPEHAEARYHRGVLEVHVKKKPQEARGHKVLVKAV